MQGVEEFGALLIEEGEDPFWCLLIKWRMYLNNQCFVCVCIWIRSWYILLVFFSLVFSLSCAKHYIRCLEPQRVCCYVNFVWGKLCVYVSFKQMVKLFLWRRETSLFWPWWGVFYQMEHMFLCLFHASEECHGSRRLPCSAFAPIVVRDRVTLSCSVSAKRYSVFHTTNSADGRQTLLTAGKLQRGVASATVCHCCQFWATRDDAKLNTSRRIISCGLAAACVPIRRESNSISLQGNSQCIEVVSSFHLWRCAVRF